MTGWHISIFRQADGGSSPARADSEEGIRLAVWQTGSEGLDWVDELVKNGHAINLGGNGYPRRYTARGEYLLPRIAGGPPEARSVWECGEHSVITSKWTGKTVVDGAAADDCRPDEWLLVVAWDES